MGGRFSKILLQKKGWGRGGGKYTGQNFSKEGTSVGSRR